MNTQLSQQHTKNSTYINEGEKKKKKKKERVHLKYLQKQIYNITSTDTTKTAKVSGEECQCPREEEESI